MQRTFALGLAVLLRAACGLKAEEKKATPPPALKKANGVAKTGAVPAPTSKGAASEKAKGAKPVTKIRL